MSMRLDEAAYDLLVRVFRRRREEGLRDQRQELRKEAPEYQRSRRVRWLVASLIVTTLLVIGGLVMLLRSHSSPPGAASRQAARHQNRIRATYRRDGARTTQWRIPDRRSRRAGSGSSSPRPPPGTPAKRRA